MAKTVALIPSFLFIIMRHPNKVLPPNALLRKYFTYDPESGNLIWKIRPAYSVPEGSIAGCLKNTGYIMVQFQRRFWQSHRLIYKLVTGIDPGDFVIDHIDGDTTNNSWSNLRLCTIGENNLGRVNGSGRRNRQAVLAGN